MFKKFGRGFSSTALKVLLYMLAVLVATVIVFGTAAHLKKALATSNIYNTFVDNALDEAKKSAKPDESSGGSSDISLDQPIVREAAKQAFTPALLQSSAEGALDGLYSWLQQKTPTPQFTIDLSEAKATFANSVSNSLAARIQALPACTTAQLRALDVNNLDLFNLPCRPPGVNLEAERQKVVADITNNKEFLDKPVVTAQDLPRDEDGKTVTEQLNQLPKAFRWLTIAPWIIGVVALLCVAGVVLLFEDKRRALRSLWITFLSIGVVLLFSFWITTWLFNKASQNPNLALQDTGFQKSGISLAKSLASDVNNVILWFAIIYLLIAAVIGGVWWWLGKKHPTPSADVAPKA